MNNVAEKTENTFWGKIKGRKLGARAQKNIIGWLIFFPTVFWTVFVGYRNILAGVRLAFYETKGFEVVKFVGLGNFIKVLKDDLFMTALVNNLEYVFWGIMTLWVPVVFAIAVNEVFKGSSFFKFALYYPCIVPGIVTSLLWNILLNSGEGGLLNMLLGTFGIGPIGWLQDPKFVIASIQISGSWGFGGTMIYYLSALQSVNPDLYEAAELDGAGFWRKLWNITMPKLLPLFGLMLMMSVISSLGTYERTLTMTNGGPNNASLTLGMLVYNYAFSYLQLGRASATSILMSFLIMGFTIIYVRMQKRLND